MQMQKYLDMFLKFSQTKSFLIGAASTFLLWLGRRYFNGTWNSCTRDVSNKTIIITGCNNGIGKATAADLLANGAEVIFACRDETRAKEAISSLPLEHQKKAIFMKLDLLDLISVYNFAQEFRGLNRTIDSLINNAGVFQVQFGLSKDGIENTY